MPAGSPGAKHKEAPGNCHYSGMAQKKSGLFVL
jgi:hypothetical protein